MMIYRTAGQSSPCPHSGTSTRQKTPPIFLALWFLGTLFLSAARMMGQSNAVDGALDGYVRSTDDAPLPGAAIVTTNIATGVAQTARSNEDGYFRFPLVPQGTYDLQVSAPGFATLNQRGVSITVGSGVHLTLRMSVSSEATAITVNADASILETHSPAMGATLNQESIEDLPIVTRDVYNLFQFSPGIKGVPSTGFGTPTLSFGGIQRTQWNVDGQDNTSRQFTSNIRLVVNTPETLQGTQVLSNGYSAEFGRSAGGQVNLFTRAGTNAYHGQVLGFFRPYSLQAIKGPTVSGSNSSVAEQHWDDFAFTFGGPILHDRLFFLANYEVNPYVIPTAVTVLPVNAATLGLPASYTNQIPTGRSSKRRPDGWTSIFEEGTQASCAICTLQTISDIPVQAVLASSREAWTSTTRRMVQKHNW
jgi:hypothetical protein